MTDKRLPSFKKSDPVIKQSAKPYKLSVTTASILLSAGLVASLTTGCQSTVPSYAQTADPHLSQTARSLTSNLTPEEAKSTLVTAIQNQRRQTYAYEMHVKLDNHNQRSELAQASELQLAMAEEDVEHCNHVHDEAYATLIERAEADGLEVTDEAYAVQRKAIKEAYLSCDAELEAWQESRGFDGEIDFQNVIDILSDMDEDDVLTDDQLQEIEASFSKTATDDANDLTDTSDAEEDMPPTREEFLPNYDNQHTRAKVRDANVVNAYVIKPLDMTTTGVYRPRIGLLTVSPTIQYTSRLHTTAINQPIMIDAKTGTLYLWADNFAYPMSEYLDPDLGLAWQDKWLALTLDDGSLPKGFGRHLIETVFKAGDEADANITTSKYNAFSASEVLTLMPDLPASQERLIKGASQIFGVTLTGDDLDAYSDTYLQTLYDGIVDKYPELNPDTAPDPDSLSEAEVLATLAIETNEDIEDEIGDPSLSSAILVRQGLAFIQELLAEDDIEEDKVIDEEIGLSDEALDEVDPSDTDSFDDDLDAMDAEQEAPYREVPKSIVYAQLPKSPEDNGVGNTLGNEDAESEYNGKDSAISQLSSQGYQAFYGLDNRGNIAWQMNHTPDATDLSYRMFIRYDGLSSQAKSMPFPNLPADKQTPNIQNSVDIRPYLTDLKERTAEGEGTPEGEEFFGLVNILIQLMLMEVVR